MAKKYVQEGDILTWTNDTGSDVAGDSVIVMGQTLAVALDDIADTESGAVAVNGVWELPKVSGAVVAQGESLVWDSSAGAFDDNQATPASGDVSGAAAVAAADGADGEATLLVRLTGVPGTVTA